MKARVNPDTQTWEYGPDEMPARKGWLPFIEVGQPSITSSQVAYLVDPVVVDSTVIMTWAIRNKTADELQADADAAELKLVKAVYNALKNGTGTNAERITRLERCVARILKSLYT